MARMGTGTGTTSAPSSALPAGAAVFYRFRDPSGRLHIVDSLDLVPPAERAHVERIAFGAEAAQSPLAPLRALPGFQGAALAGAIGVGLLLLLALLFPRLRGSLGWLVRLAVGAGVVLLLTFGYLGWMRRATGASGASGAVLASPSAFIDDAKGAVEKMNAHLRAQEAELKAVEQAK